MTIPSACGHYAIAHPLTPLQLTSTAPWLIAPAGRSPISPEAPTGRLITQRTGRPGLEGAGTLGAERPLRGEAVLPR